MRKFFGFLLVIDVIFAAFCFFVGMVFRNGQDYGVIWIGASLAAGCPLSLGVIFLASQWNMGDAVFAILCSICAVGNIVSLGWLSGGKAEKPSASEASGGRPDGSIES
jgi:hypothetical protein